MKIMKISGCLAAAFAVLALVGCSGGGGGGGGNSTPPATTPPSVSTKTVQCPTGVSETASAADDASATVAANALCPVATIAVTPADGAATVSVNTTVVFTSNAALINRVVTLKAGGVNAVAVNSSQSPDTTVLTLTPQSLFNYGQLYTATITGQDSLGRTVSATSTFTTTVAPPPKCVAPQTLDSNTNTCVTPVLHYTDKVIVMETGGYGLTPYLIPSIGATPVAIKNVSQYQSGYIPVGSCGVYEVPVENGIVAAKCQVSADLSVHIFAIDPVAGTMDLYKGSYVFDDTKFHSVGWGTFGNTPYAAYDIGLTGMYATIAGGTYFVTNGDRYHLRLTSDNFATSSVVATLDQTKGEFGAMISYTHP